MTYATDFEWHLHLAQKATAKDKQQRWVYQDGPSVWTTTEPVPYRDAVSVRWMPIHRCVAVAYRPRALAHSAV